MTEEEINLAIYFRTTGILSELHINFGMYIMGKYFYGVPIPEDVELNMKVAMDQFITDMQVLRPGFQFSDIQKNGRMLMGYDGVVSVAGNQTIDELIGSHEIYSFSVDGVLINNLPNPAHNPDTGELYYEMAVGEKFRLTYKPK